MGDVPIQYCLLGPVTAWRAGEEIDLGWARQRAVLAVLLREMNRPVSMETIIDTVWGERPPKDARRAVQTNISRLRSALQPGDGPGDRDDVLITVGAGYQLRGNPIQLDTVVFEWHLTSAGELRRARDLSAAAAAVNEALGLWRGEPFGGVSGPWVDSERERWRERRLAALELRAVILLDLGQHAATLAELTQLVRDFPLREQFCELVMLALYRSGRQADALQHYHGLRAQLADEVGVDPSPTIQRLYQRILLADQELASPSPDPDTAADGPPVPRDLPPAPAEFLGRARELAILTATVGAAATAPMTMVAALSGGTGMGKTWLALYWAYQHAERFPDGQLYVDLSCGDTTGMPLSAADALRALIHAIRGDVTTLPSDPDRLVVHYHRLLTGKRILILLDDAHDAQQIVPLIPNNSSCTILVTSRKRIADLAELGAELLDVEPLSEHETRELLTRHLGAARLAVQPDAACDLVRWCAGRPSTIGAVSVRAGQQPDVPLAELLGELEDISTRLVEAGAEAVTRVTRALAVQSSARDWQAVIDNRDPSAELRRCAAAWAWPLSVLTLAQIGVLSQYLSGGLCRGLLEMSAVVEYAGRSRGWDVERARLTGAFTRELAHQLVMPVDQAGQVAAPLWADLSDSIRNQVDEIRAEREFTRQDLAYLNTMTRVNDVTAGTSDISRIIVDRAAISADPYRISRAQAAARLIAASAQERYSKQVMPHSREDHQIPIVDIYVSRTLRAGPVTATTIGMSDGGVIDVVDEQIALTGGAGVDEGVAETDLTDRRFVVVGNPGAGKSTFTRHLLYQTGMTTRNDSPVAPMMLELKEHARPANSYVTVLTEQLRAMTQTELDIETVRDILTLGLATVVFDGLDEVGQLDDRRSTVTAIQAFCRRYPLVRIVVTSRQEGYVGARLDPTLFPVYQLPDFTDDQVEVYVRRWFHLTATTRGYDPVQRVASFLSDSAHVMDLRNNPLMLSLLCLLYDYEGYIPENRPAVYEQCAELLFERWDRIRRIPLKFQPNSQVRYLVQELAYYFFTQRPQGGETERRLRSLIGTYFERNIVTGDESATTQAEEFLEYCAGRSWLLTQIKVSDRGERQFGFTHRTFMEYFAACFIVRQCDNAAELVEHINPLILNGTSDVVPQIAIQQFDLRRANGIDECLRILVFGRRGRGMTADRSTCLLFALRSLEFMRPSPAVLREIQLDALRMVGEAADPEFLTVMCGGRPDVLEQLARTVRSLQPTIEDAGGNMALRLGAALFTVLIDMPRANPIRAGHNDYIQNIMLSNEAELRRLANVAPDLIAEMRKRAWIPKSHQIAQ